MNKDHDNGSAAAMCIQRTSSHAGQKRGAAKRASDAVSAPGETDTTNRHLEGRGLPQRPAASTGERVLLRIAAISQNTTTTVVTANSVVTCEGRSLRSPSCDIL